MPPSPTKCLAQASTDERIAQPLALQAADRRFAELGDEVRIFGEAFVGAAPALVARHRDAGGEGPMDARGADLFRRDAADFFDQLRIARAAQADVVREDHRAEHVVVAVHGVDAVENRDAEPRLERLLLAAVVGVGPGFEAVARLPDRSRRR